MSPGPPNTLPCWWDDDADGGANMGADEALAAEAHRRGTLLVRIYGWSATTVSLGGFQGIDEALGIEEIRGVPLVRRPSGGGAIVHGSDLTYAAAVPKSHPWGAIPQRLYDALHGAMAEELQGRGIAAELHRAAGAPGLAGPFFCFDRRASGDLVVAGGGGPPAKVMGSAQRRLAGVVLQHGSLLLQHNTDVPGRARHPGLADLSGFTGRPPDRRELSRCWLERVADLLGATLAEQPGPFLCPTNAEAARLSRRFRDQRWTSRR